MLTQIITPKGILAEYDVNMTVVPGIEGEFAVLNDHISFVSTIDSGVVKFFDVANIQTSSFFVATGVCEVKDNKCVILVEEGVLLSEIAPSDIELRLNHAKNMLEKKEKIDEHEAVYYERDLEVAMKLLDILVSENKSK